MLLHIAARHKMHVEHMDVRSAFLHADLGNYELYVKPPQGFESYDSEGNLLVCKLNKSLYGLKQSGRNWNSLLDDFLKSDGFVQSKSDPCLYTKIGENFIIIVLAWVDDLSIVSDNESEMTGFKSILS